MNAFELARALRAAACLTLSLVFLSLTPGAHAHVYATDIQLNGSLTGITTNPTPANPLTITYRLNEPATMGCTVAILNGATSVATIVGGTNMGSNSVAWGGTNQSGSALTSGTYNIGITAAAKGFTNWTQISVDTNAGMPAFNPWGIDVDKNTNSPYYGRVVVSCASMGTGTGNEIDGLYKMNADGSQADEGWYGSAGYTNDDAGDGPVLNTMPDSSGFNPLIIRIGEDDRIYWVDNSAVGAIVACDMLATTNQLVINSGNYTNSNGYHSMVPSVNNYQNCPDIGDLQTGIQQFDVSAATGTDAAIYLVDTSDFPTWGVWMYHLTNGAADPADNVGTQAVGTNSIIDATGAGISVDDNLDVFVSQAQPGSADSLNETFSFRNWNGGVLPPEGDGSARTYALPNFHSPSWGVGANDSTMTGIFDTAINSRVNPTMVAVAMVDGANNPGGYSAANGGIRVLSAATGSILATNLDSANWYNSAAFDNVGNVYGCSRSLHLWRVWSPSGGSTNTTTAVATLSFPPPFAITGITAVPYSAGVSTVTINFTGPNLAPSAYSVAGSSSVNGIYSAVMNATITGSAGSYQASFTNSATQFFQITYP